MRNFRRIGLTATISGVAALLACCFSAHAHVVGQAAPPAATPYTFRNVQIVGGGFVDGLLFHPTQKNLLYARTDVGGAYRWDEAAQRWVALTDGFGDSEWNLTGIESLAVDPTDPKRLYAAVGTYTNDWGGKGAILRSDNQGRDWQRTDMPIKMGGNENGRFAGERLAVDPNAPDHLYFGSRNAGLWRSADRGATWAQVSSFPMPSSGPGGASEDLEGIGVVFVLFAPGKSTETGVPTRTIYVGVSAKVNGGLWRSVDGGATFQPVAGQPMGMMVNHGAIGADGAMYLSYGDKPGPNGMADGAIWRWNMSSNIWTDITPQKPGVAGAPHFGYGGLALDAEHPGTLMVATMDRWSPGDTLFRSTDAGAHWTDVGLTSVRDSRLSPWLTWGRPGMASLGHWMGALAIDPFAPGHVLYGTGATIWASRDVTAADKSQPTHWTVGAVGLEETVVSGLVSPPTGAPLLSSVLDIGGFRHENLDASPPSGFDLPAHGSNDAIDCAELNPNVAARTFGHSGGYSLDNGKTWTDFATAPPGNSSGKIAVSADGATIVWSPERGGLPALTTDHGTTWTTCAGLPSGIGPVTADRAAPHRFYAFDAKQGTLYASADSAAHFTAQATDLPPVGAELRAAPGHPGDLCLISYKGLYHSADGGAHFVRVGTATGNHIAFGIGAPGSHYPALYLAGTIDRVEGLFRSDDGGRTWTRIDDNRHRFGGIRTLAADGRVYGRVYIGTGGRGIVYGEPGTNKTLTER